MQIWGPFGVPWGSSLDPLRLPRAPPGAGLGRRQIWSEIWEAQSLFSNDSTALLAILELIPVIPVIRVMTVIPVSGVIKCDSGPPFHTRRGSG